jgi:hypothetical protein
VVEARSGLVVSQQASQHQDALLAREFQIFEIFQLKAGEAGVAVEKARVSVPLTCAVVHRDLSSEMAA